MDKRDSELIQSNLKALDYMEGEGLFPRDTRSVLPNTRFLIVSYGGTGGAALYTLKKQLEREFKPKELGEKVRILAVDTDETARYEQKVETDEETGQQHTTTKELFTAAEFHWLDAAPARNAVFNNHLQDAEHWVNPSLIELIWAKPRDYLDGNGAASTRQVGRLLITQEETYQQFEDKIKQLVKELTDNNGDQLKIFVLSGIAGGTGSGIVIDASFLIRSIVEDMNVLENRVKMCGIILLPPTGNSQKPVDIDKGNRNGYAALKEIDHFMTMGVRGEAYEQTFGYHHIRVDKNLFDTCYLVDGSITGMGFNDPRGRAMSVVADCIVDMISSQQAVGAAIQTVDAFMSDANAYTDTLLSQTPYNIAPRDANFIYCALGHAQTLIPLDLLKAYVAKGVFDKMYALFEKAGRVTDQDVKAFLDKVGCPKDGFLDGAGRTKPRELRNQIDAETDRIFRDTTASKGGPFYTINLLKAALQEVDERGAAVSRLSGLAVQKNERVDLLKAAYDELGQLNSETFAVKQMQAYLQQGYDICTSQERTAHSYYYEPISFGGTDEKSRLVRDYLDGLVSSVNTGRMCQDLVDEMVDKRDEWTNLMGEGGDHARFNVARRIQAFWKQGVEKILDATLENFLIKYYTQDPDAQLEFEPDDVTLTATSQKGLKEAAKAIVDQMFGGGQMATPLVALNTHILTLNTFNVHRFFLIPKAAPHLKEFVEADIANRAGANAVNPNTVTVASSTANDRISCYTQFTSLPAYMLKWVCEAEKNYENHIYDTGLHMAETVEGENWRGFPNLVNETIWPLLRNEYKQPREAAISQRISGLFDEALRLQLADLTAKQGAAGALNVTYYTLRLLGGDFQVKRGFFKKLDGQAEGTRAKQEAQEALDEEVRAKADKLFALADWENEPAVTEENLLTALINAGAVFERIEVKAADTVLTTPGNKPENWEQYLAKKLLRLNLEGTDKLRGTILVLNELLPRIQKAQSRKRELSDFAKYLIAGLFTKDKDEGTWNTLDENGFQKTLLELNIGVKAEELAEEYLVFKAFQEQAADLGPVLEEKFREDLKPTEAEITAANGKETAALRTKKQALIQKAKDKKAELAAKLDVKKPDSLATKSYEKLATAAGLDVAAIRSFYLELSSVLDEGSFPVLLAQYK